MLAADQRTEFENRGLLRLPAAISAEGSQGMQNRLWQHLREECGAESDRPATWPVGVRAHFQAVTRTGAFNGLASPSVRAAIDALLGPRTWREPEQWGRPLVTFPDSPVWRLPARGWHRDSSDRVGDPILVVLACLAPLQPTGGGTLVVTGSHQLTAPHGRYGGLRSAQVRDRLAADHWWFGDLLTPAPEPERTERLLGAGCIVEGTTLEIVELTGSPGDAFLMHPRSLHAVAPNALEAPRLMLLQFL